VIGPHDRLNPDAWDALYLDQALPLDPVVKAYMIKDLRSWTRSYLLLPIKAVANLLLALVMTVKRLLPFQFNAHSFMHRSAAFFLNTFVSPEACYLIVRHLGIGSNIVNFLIDNGPDPAIQKSILYPPTVDDLAENAFLEHDLILYNFVFDYARAQQAHPQWLQKVREKGIIFDSVQPIKIDIDFSNRSWLKILDLESTLELFKVFYSLCLTSAEFERAVLSLQFDENFGLYVATLLGNADGLHLITNRHPLAPNSPFSAARNLLLHGLVTEYLHRHLEVHQQRASKATNVEASALEH
jgi:hypothetical protein